MKVVSYCTEFFVNILRTEKQWLTYCRPHLLVYFRVGKYLYFCRNSTEFCFKSRTENVTERTRFSKSRSNDLEDKGQGQRSSHATHLLMLVIICTKYGKNPSRTVDATKQTRFSRSRQNYLENIGQGQRSLHVCDTASDANDDLCQIWKECKQNCRFFFF